MGQHPHNMYAHMQHGNKEDYNVWVNIHNMYAHLQHFVINMNIRYGSKYTHTHTHTYLNIVINMILVPVKTDMHAHLQHCDKHGYKAWFKTYTPATL